MRDNEKNTYYNIYIPTPLLLGSKFKWFRIDHSTISWLIKTKEDREIMLTESKT